MKILLRTLRTLIHEVAVATASLPREVGLIVRERNDYVTMAFVELKTIKSILSRKSHDAYSDLSHAIVGAISFGYSDVWRVTNVKAAKGYGPTLYRLAMQYATQHGSSLSSDPDGSTSPDAQRVWDRFAEQTDVEVVFLGDEYGDQRDIAYQLDGDDASALMQRYEAVLAQFDQTTRDDLDEMLDEALGEAVMTFG